MFVHDSDNLSVVVGIAARHDQEAHNTEQVDSRHVEARTH